MAEPYTFLIEVETPFEADTLYDVFHEPMNVKLIGKEQADLIVKNVEYDSKNFSAFSLELKIHSIEDARALYAILNHTDNIKHLEAVFNNGIVWENARYPMGAHFNIDSYNLDPNGFIARGIERRDFYIPNNLKLITDRGSR